MNVRVKASLTGLRNYDKTLTEKEAYLYQDGKTSMFKRIELMHHFCTEGFNDNYKRAFVQVYCAHLKDDTLVYVFLEDIGDTFVLFCADPYEEFNKVVNRAWVTTDLDAVMDRFNKLKTMYASTK